ncbi:hypothetical protein [uncultured Sphingomonas sp.]|uniref:DUF6950 family protein n=1 Tax=uncultured Sphingomonas sp. TaxID=158754 RepID=UPI0025FDB73F|nr:hypothetical protein [uncultured Sphingomonas sp.]
MMRRADWEARLHDFLLARAGACHTYGATDCCLNAADAVLAMTDIDLAADFRGRYTTASGAARALKRYGAGTLEATLDAMLPVVEPAFARRGDLVHTQDLVAIVIGADAVALGVTVDAETTTEGWVRFPRAEWVKGWAVG